MGESRLTPADIAAAHAAAQGFLKAAKAGDEAAVMALLIPASGQSLDIKSMRDSVQTHELGQPVAEGQQVIVVAKAKGPLPPPPPGQPPAPEELPLVLACRDGAWKVDMGASINRMLGVNLEDMMDQLVKGMGDAMGKMAQAMGDAVSQGLSAMSDGAAGAIEGSTPSTAKPEMPAPQGGASAPRKKPAPRRKK